MSSKRHFRRLTAFLNVILVAILALSPAAAAPLAEAPGARPASAVT